MKILITYSPKEVEAAKRMAKVMKPDCDTDNIEYMEAEMGGAKLDTFTDETGAMAVHVEVTPNFMIRLAHIVEDMKDGILDVAAAIVSLNSAVKRLIPGYAGIKQVFEDTFAVKRIR